MEHKTQNIQNKYLFEKLFKDFGTISIRQFRLSEDSDILHQWVNMDYAVFWGMQGYTLPQVQQEYAKLITPDHYDIFVGTYQNKPVFVLERYDPKQDPIEALYNSQKGDVGVHIIVAPPGIRIPNFTWYLFTTIMEFVFQDTDTNRILVEPDIRNKKMFALCNRIGFQLDKVIEFPHKTAQLAFLTRERYDQFKSIPQFNKRSAMNTLDNAVSPQQSIAHLQPEVWVKVNTLLVTKAICEFSHELLIKPYVLENLKDGWNMYTLKTDNPNIQYQFNAKPLALNHLWIDSDSIKKYINSESVVLDAVLFIKEFKKQLGIKDSQMPVYLEEIVSTLYGSAFKFLKGNPTAQELVDADFQTIEQSMTEGHPGFVANNGRIGFDSSDYRSYAPEAGNSFSLLWLAGHKSKAVYAATTKLPYDILIEQELDRETINSFNTTIKNRGYDPEGYFFIPMHPWQWFNKLANIFSPEIATGNLICLGYGPDQYLAQQSIRTLFNITNPDKFYTKTALSILNMGFMRGLPLYYLGTAPKMAVWLEELLYNDSYIQETGFRMLSEIASVSYVNPYFEEFGPHNDYNKMLASLWRESPIPNMKEKEQAMTMAAFLHIDHHGEALLPKIIDKSGLIIEDWLHLYLKAYLCPLLHCFYHYDLVFMPHGENIIMVLEDHIPVKAFLKDITEEACILSPDVELPDHLKRMYAPVPEDVKLLSVFTDIFDGFFRYMSHILYAHADFPESRFWEVVASTIQEYQDRYPEKEAKFKQYDLFASDFHLSCLNRLQLNNHKQMIDLDDPVALLQFAGKLENPIAAYRKKSIQTVS
ncbi:GNAT family N-acetyltransferase [Aquimarina sp. 2201CG5-10]|uniref:GNAT family N-acetyltransferase n=1 Tax=Aquimarina callyspongiae TaxID=3098150 RepID=UPI002AB49130|nr:GNAT family N-acetyltransferase [Aquimarina sp. 2201CG5-10]MDY8135932.1 GNAT family N-acetyltransferase [Aquimarina sp. 2201CG5-10]